jgi:histidinol-phosphate/aromatic aminotransferase/cobyric acid decarboxylase-like protein
MTDEPLTPNTAEMQARIREVQDRRRDRIRWSIGKHTAELAIAALRDAGPYVPSSKRRARKRRKRLL